MAARTLGVMALLAIVLFTGCSGGGGGTSPVVIAGNYFPLTIGSIWTYNTVLEAETPTDDFNTTGTMTRTLVGTEDIIFGGVPTNTLVFEHTYTTAAVPNLTGPSSIRVAPFINYLFAANGGLAPIRAYYRQVPATADVPANLELIALSKAGGPPVIVRFPRPYQLTPPYHGAMQQATLWFTPMPLMPFVTDLASAESHDKMLNYGGSGGLGGNANCIVSINFYSADLTVGGDTAALAGRGRTFYKDGIGLWGFDVATDWYGTINVQGDTSRVYSTLQLTSYTPGP